MNPTIRLRNQIPRIIQELLPKLAQEKVISDHTLRNTQLPLRRLEIELAIQLLQETRDGVLILVFLGLDDFDDLFECIPDTGGGRVGGRGRGFAREDGSGGEVAEDPRAGGLDGIEVRWREERLQQERSALRMIEIYEQAPMQEPGP